MSKKRPGGFSLIEVVLALLVASVGIMSLTGLLSGGLSMSERAVQEARIALFAEQVLNAARAKAAAGPAKPLELDFPPPLPVEGMWAQPKDLRVQGTGADFAAIEYVAAVSNSTGKVSIPEFGLRYRLRQEAVSAMITEVHLEVMAGIKGPAETNRFFAALWHVYEP